MKRGINNMSIELYEKLSKLQKENIELQKELLRRKMSPLSIDEQIEARLKAYHNE